MPLLFRFSTKQYLAENKDHQLDVLGDDLEQGVGDDPCVGAYLGMVLDHGQLDIGLEG